MTFSSLQEPVADEDNAPDPVPEENNHAPNAINTAAANFPDEDDDEADPPAAPGNVQEIARRNKDAERDREIFELRRQVAFYKGALIFTIHSETLTIIFSVGVARNSRAENASGPLAGTKNIGNGVRIEKGMLMAATLKCKGEAQLYLRILTLESGIFSLEEIANSSITGRPDPRNPKAKPKPALDPVRLSALTGRVNTSYLTNFIVQ